MYNYLNLLIFQPGLYVKLYLEGVTEQEYKNIDCSLPLLATAMLPHEQKMSVISLLLKRPNLLELDEPIKSKEELIIQCGYRRFKCCPIFSQLGNGTVHKVSKLSIVHHLMSTWPWSNDRYIYFDIFIKVVYFLTVRKIFPTWWDGSCDCVRSNSVSTVLSFGFQGTRGFFNCKYLEKFRN